MQLTLFYTQTYSTPIVLRLGVHAHLSLETALYFIQAASAKGITHKKNFYHDKQCARSIFYSPFLPSAQSFLKQKGQACTFYLRETETQSISIFFSLKFTFVYMINKLVILLFSYFITHFPLTLMIYDCCLLVYVAIAFSLIDLGGES